MENNKLTKTKPTGLQLIYTYAMDKRNATFAMCHVNLDEEIDFGTMEEALLSCYKKFSYMNKKVIVEDDNYYFIQTEVTPHLYKDELSHIIDESDNDGLLYRFGVCGSKLIVSFFHCLTDGKGILLFIKYLLLEYFARKNPNETKKCIDEIKLIEKEFDLGKEFDPMSLVPNNKVTYQKQNEFFVIQKNIENRKHYRYAYNFSCDGEKLLKYAKASDGTPNAIMSIVMARAIKNLYPNSIEKGIDVSITIDAKPIIGADKSFLPCLHSSTFHFDEKTLKLERETLHTCVRGKIIIDSDKDSLFSKLNALRVVEKLFVYMKSLNAKRLLACQSTDKPRSSGNISYAGTVDFGSISHHIDSIYSYADSAAPLLEINYLNGRFFFALSSPFEAKELAIEICKECKLMDIDCSEPVCFVLNKEKGKKQKLGINLATIQMINAIRKLKKETQ